MFARADIHADIARLVLAGRITQSDCPMIQTLAREALACPGLQWFQVDLKGVELLDSSALGTFASLRKQAARRGLRLSMLHPEGRVRRVLETVGFDRLFEIIQ